MPSFHSPFKGWFRNPYVLRLPHNNVPDDWPEEIFEQIVGIPDILNEKLADEIVAANIKKAKQNGTYQEYSGLPTDSGSPQNNRRSLVSRAIGRLRQKTVSKLGA